MLGREKRLWLSMLKFITGNKNKLREMQGLLAPIEIEHMDIDLDEIQSLDPHEIITHKLLEARKHHQGEFFVEDVSFFMECFDYKFPGPLAKWFLESLGPLKMYETAKALGKTKAYGQTLIGYMDASGEIHFFEGRNNAELVYPRGEKDWGYGPIFMPEGYDKTFGEMEKESKAEISYRGIAARKLKDYLLKK